ncbi:hypothetical protein [Streptomyces sp. DW26H14]
MSTPTDPRSDHQKPAVEAAPPIFAGDDNGMRGATNNEPYPTFDNEEN